MKLKFKLKGTIGGIGHEEFRLSISDDHWWTLFEYGINSKTKALDLAREAFALSMEVCHRHDIDFDSEVKEEIMKLIEEE